MGLQKSDKKGSSKMEGEELWQKDEDAVNYVVEAGWA